MASNITTINFPLPFKMGSVNCYLVKGKTGFILVDTGCSNTRTAIEHELALAGCQAGDLNLIVITHGDFDHTGNAAYLQEKFNTKIAMHAADFGMAERGDMLSNRKSTNLLNRMIALLTQHLMGFNQSERFTPDHDLKDGENLAEYGLDAEIVAIPGHSQGSIGILTSNGDLFCGDLFENITRPKFNSIMDDLATAQTSVEKLKDYDINIVYPGHGDPFPMPLLQTE